MNKLEEISQRRERANANSLLLNSKVYKAFQEMQEAAFAEGALPKKTKELIALGISIVVNCESCTQWHVEQAYKAGASTQEIMEAIEVSIEMGGGPATVTTRLALEAIDSLGDGKA